MRTSFTIQPEAQHPKSSAIHKLPADYPSKCQKQTSQMWPYCKAREQLASRNALILAFKASDPASISTAFGWGQSKECLNGRALGRRDYACLLICGHG